MISGPFFLAAFPAWRVVPARRAAGAESSGHLKPDTCRARAVSFLCLACGSAQRPAPSPHVPRLVRPVTGTHGLLRSAKEHYPKSRKVDNAEHLKPYKIFPKWNVKQSVLARRLLGA